MSSRDGKEASKEGGRLPAANTIPVFRLYVSGATPKSTRVISNLKRSLDSMFAGRYELAVIDIHAEPHKAKAAGVHATPMLVKVYPPPVRTVVGSFSSKECIQRILGAGNQYGSGGKPDGKQSDENR